MTRPGQLIAGRYLLGRCLARGGMGAVWEAQHVELETRVAIKLLRPELGENTEHVERFRREARTAAKLRSPHVVAIHDCGVDHGTPFIAMEFLEGEDLELRLRRLGRLEADEALNWLDQAARGLAVAHAAGLVHRDVKPANLFIERLPTGERLKVVDFGIARPLASDVTLTSGTGVWGSPAYMSPEQARGRAVDQRTDVWALAAVFYRALTGELPFRGQTEHDVIVLVCTGQARAPSELGLALPVALDRFFERAFAKDPEERISSVEELAQEAAEAMGKTLPAFDLPASRPSTPPHEASSSALDLRLGRVTETKPIGGDTGPTGVTAPKAGRPGPASRRVRVTLLAGALMASAGALYWAAGSPPATPAKAPISNDAARPKVGPQPAAKAPPEVRSESPAAVQPVRPAPATENASRPDHRPSKHTRTLERSSERHGAPARTPPAEAPSGTPTDPLFGLPLEGDDAK